MLFALWPPQSPHQPSGLSRLFTGTHIFHSFKILSHIFKESCNIWAFTGCLFFLMVYPNKGVSTKKEISGVLLRWQRGDETRKWLHICVKNISICKPILWSNSKTCWAKSWLDQTPSTSPPFSESGISEWNIFANRYITEIEMYFANKLQMMYSYCMSCLSAIYAIGDVWFSNCLIMSVTLADCAAVF